MAAVKHVGQLSAAGVRIGICVGRFNEIVTKLLLDGALEAVERHGGDPSTIDVRRTHAMQLAHHMTHDKLKSVVNVLQPAIDETHACITVHGHHTNQSCLQPGCIIYMLGHAML